MANGPSILKFQIFMKKYFLYIELILKWFFFLKTTLLNSFIKKNNYMIYIVSHKFKDFTRPPRKALVWNIFWGKCCPFWFQFWYFEVSLNLSLGNFFKNVAWKNYFLLFVTVQRRVAKQSVERKIKAPR